MMLTGKQLRPRQALKAGLVDEVPQAILLQAAVELALKDDRPAGRCLFVNAYWQGPGAPSVIPVCR